MNFGSALGCHVSRHRRWTERDAFSSQMFKSNNMLLSWSQFFVIRCLLVDKPSHAAEKSCPFPAASGVNGRPAKQAQQGSHSLPQRRLHRSRSELSRSEPPSEVGGTGERKSRAPSPYPELLSVARSNRHPQKQPHLHLGEKYLAGEVCKKLGKERRGGY